MFTMSHDLPPTIPAGGPWVHIKSRPHRHRSRRRRDFDARCQCGRAITGTLRTISGRRPRSSMVII